MSSGSGSSKSPPRGPSPPPDPSSTAETTRSGNRVSRGLLRESVRYINSAGRSAQTARIAFRSASYSLRPVPNLVCSSSISIGSAANCFRASSRYLSALAPLPNSPIPELFISLHRSASQMYYGARHLCAPSSPVSRAMQKTAYLLGVAAASFQKAALAASKADPETRRGDLARSRSPLLGNPRDGDATRSDSAPAQHATAVNDTPRAGGSGVVTPSASGGFVSPNPPAGTSDDRTPREGRPKLRFSHILVKHKNSRRPVDNDNKPVTRTKDQAMELIIDIHEKITKDLITFADAAVSFSDCTSARNEGDIHSRFKRGRMQTSFQNAALALGPGKISDIVETTSGFHIIQRGDSRPSVDSHPHSSHRPRSRSPRSATSRDGDAAPTDPKPGQSTPRDSASRGAMARYAVPLDGESRPIEVRAGTARNPVARYAVPRHAVTRHTVVRHAGARHVVAHHIVARDAMARDGTVPDVVTRDSTGRDSVARDGSSCDIKAQVTTERNDIPKDEASDNKVSGNGASGVGASDDGASVAGVSVDKDSEEGKSKLRRIPIKDIPKKSRELVDVQNNPVTHAQGEAMDLLIDIQETVPDNVITTVDAAVSFSDNEPETTGTYDDPSRLAMNPEKIIHNTESDSGMLQRPE